MDSRVGGLSTCGGLKSRAAAPEESLQTPILQVWRLGCVDGWRLGGWRLGSCSLGLVGLLGIWVVDGGVDSRCLTGMGMIVHGIDSVEPGTWYLVQLVPGSSLAASMC